MFLTPSAFVLNETINHESNLLATRPAFINSNPPFVQKSVHQMLVILTSGLDPKVKKHCTIPDFPKAYNVCT